MMEFIFLAATKFNDYRKLRNDNELKRIGQLLRHDENIGVFNKFLICFVVLRAQALKTLSHEFW